MIRKLSIFILSTLTLTLSVFAELTLPTIFTDHMVIQRGQPVPVWGTDTPHSTITVEFDGQTKSITTDADGKWRIDLDPMTADSKSQTLTLASSTGSKAEIKDVLIGEVWLCSGQSNMSWSMKRSENGAAAIAASENPLIRLYATPRKFAQAPAERIDAAWKPCNPQTVSEFSAVAYFFGKKLYEELGVPIGLLQSDWGGSKIEPWLAPSGLEGFESLADIREQIRNFPPGFGTDSEKARGERQYPSVMHNGMVHAHIPFAIKGAIWYQGESNRRDGNLYFDKTKALLKGWYDLWGYEFPFYFVQIAPFQYGQDDPSLLPEFWEVQARIVKEIPNTGMAVVSDATTLDDIHPPNKLVPGTRLALLALDNTYNQNIVSTGPTFREIRVLEESLAIVFDSAEGLTTRDGKAPDWFEISGKEGVFKPANAEIKGTSVILSSPDVTEPQVVRFAWHKLATPNLMNGAGLPAPSFRAGKPSGLEGN